MDRVYLLDATAFCYRAFYALGGLSTSYGQPTNAIYGFVNMLNKLLKEKKPKYLAICFDVSRKTFRQARYAGYKLERPAMPDTLSSQIPIIKEIVKVYNIAYFEKEGFEADDIIATLAKRLEDLSFLVTIVSSDKDTLQLVDDKITVFSPYKEKGTAYSKETILARYGVEPKKIVDLLALMGDEVDNIPGVSGIGEKTAVKLIKDFKSVDNLIKNLDKIEAPNLREAIKDNIENINLSRDLAQLDADVPLDFSLEDLRVEPPDYKELYNIFKRLEFKRLLKDLPVNQQMDLDTVGNFKLDDIKDFLNSMKDDEVILSCSYATEELYLFTKERTYCKTKINEAVSVLRDPKVKKIGYDLKKLKLFLKRRNIDLKNLYYDVMLAAYIINPSKSDYALESIAWDYLSLALKELEAAGASEVILKLKSILDNKLKEGSLDTLFYSIEMPLIDVLVDMESNGVKVDKDILKDISKDLEKRLIKLIEEIYDLAARQFNINSPKQLRDVLFDKLKLPVIKKTKTGPSTNEDVLRQLAKHHRLPVLLLEYRQLTKLKSTYIDTLPSLVNPKTERIHTSFSQVATETGRLACSQPNLQNIPIKTEIGKRIRRAIVAQDNQDYLVSADYSQIELRLLAHLSKDSALVSAFKNDKDIHKSTAALIYGIDEAQVTDSMREVAKRINFGIIYGLSAFGLAQDLEISQDQARAFIDAYFVRYPKVKEFIQAQITQAKKDGFVTTLLGRRRYIPEIENKNSTIRSLAERQAINTPIQGSAADLIKQAMIDIYNTMKNKDFLSKMILQIHDELLFEVDQRELDAIVALIKDKMENVYRLDIPVKVVIKKGKNWLEMEPA